MFYLDTRETNQEKILRSHIKQCIDQLKATEAEISGSTNDVTSPDHSQSTFLLVIQTRSQQALMKEYGNTITLMDGIYRTTKYGFPCFF